MLLSAADVMKGLEMLTDELSRRTIGTRIQIVGGAAIALQVSRAALTRDVDVLQIGDTSIVQASEAVAAKLGWPNDWLNGAANMFASHYDDEGDWTDLIQRDGIKIQIAKPELLLAMKLSAGRGARDLSDVELLLEACRVNQVSEATHIFERYFPTEVMPERSMKYLLHRLAGE